MSSSAVDVSAESFEREVIERSSSLLVVVDFWAEWCGPCRVLGPVLERAVEQMAGRAILAKVNVDDNPGLAADFGVRGIPAVKAFKDGQVVSEFVGAQGEDVVNTWLSQLVPSATDEARKRARELFGSGRQEEAIETLRALIRDRPSDYAAMLDLARLLAVTDRGEEAKDLLEKIPDSAPEASEAAAERALVELSVAGAGAGDAAQLVARFERGELGPSSSAGSEERYAAAGVLWSSGRYAEAFELLLEIVRRDRGFKDDAARRALLAAFDRFDAGDETVERARRELGMILFS